MSRPDAERTKGYGDSVLYHALAGGRHNAGHRQHDPDAGPTQGLKYKTVADANGSGNLTWTVTDSGGTANGGVDTLTETLAITVNAVNDAPGFTKGVDQSTTDESGDSDRQRLGDEHVARTSE